RHHRRADPAGAAAGCRRRAAGARDRRAIRQYPFRTPRRAGQAPRKLTAWPQQTHGFTPTRRQASAGSLTAFIGEGTSMRLAPRRANRLAARNAKRLRTVGVSSPQASRTTKYGNLFGVAALSGAMLAGAVMPVVGVAAIETKKAAASFNNLPDQLPTLTPASASVILASDGTQIATFYDENRINEPLSSIAPLMQQAQLAIEDYRFYQHGAIDFEGTLRALLRNSSSGHQQGGSDLTQQYVKNVLIQAANGDPDKVAAAQADTLQRKLQELRYAGEVQKEMTKDQILDAYLNIAFYGDNAYGVEAAARHY